MCRACEFHAFSLLNRVGINRNGDMRRILDQELDAHRARSRFGRILGLTRDIFAVVSLFGGQLQRRDGRDPFGVFDFFRFGGDALRNSGSIPVQPGELE